MTRNGKLLLVIVAYSAFVVLGSFDGLLGVAWPGMRATFGLPVDALGLLLVLGTAGYILASMLNGRLITRRGVALLLLLSTGLMFSGRLLQALSPAWWLVLLVTPLTGMGAGLLDAGMNTYAAARFRPRLLNWLHASFGIGATLGSLVMTALIASGLNWRHGIGLIGALSLGLFVTFFATRGRWRLEKEDQPDDKPEDFARNRETLRLPVVWLSVATFFFYTGIEVGLGHWIFTLLTESRGVIVETAGLWTTIYWGSFTAGRIVLGFIETNLTRLVRFALTGTVLGVLLVALDLGVVVTLLGLLLAGAAQAPVFPALIAETPSRVGLKHAPNAIGFQIAAAGLGVAILPGVAGLLGDAFGLETIVYFLLVCAVCLWLMHAALVRQRHAAAVG